MKAAIQSAPGAAPSFGDHDAPVAAAGETLVQVEAASLKQLDRAIAAGSHYASPRAFPVICGTDGAGALADGRRVYFAVERRPFGAMAELAPAAWTVDLPDGLDPALAAAIVNPALAAFLPLAWRARLQPGETVLVLGATGTSGRLAVRAARLLGAGRVIAAGRRRAVLETLDADAVVDLGQVPATLQAAFAEEAARGLDVVIDYLWGPPVVALVAALTKSDLAAHAGTGEVRLVTLGGMAEPEITLPSAALRAARLTIMGSGSGNFPPRDQLKAFVADILARTAAGELTLDVEKVPLSDVASAWARPADPDRRTVLIP